MPSMTQPRKRTGENLNVWVRSSILAKLRQFLKGTYPRTTKTAVVEAALVEFLRSRGFDPDAEDKPEED